MADKNKKENKDKRGERLIRQIDRTFVPENTLALWHLGQESMVFKGSGMIAYIDPYLSNAIDEQFGNSPRNFETPISPELIGHADLVLITHDHPDHLDPVTVRAMAIASPHATWICPAPVVPQLAELGIVPDALIGARAGDMIDFRDMRITPIASKHEEFETDENGDHKFLGYVIELNGVKLYHAGDTIGYEGLVEALRPHRIDIACMPINGRDWKRYQDNLMGNMNFREAADLGVAIGADLLIPMHYDLFAFNTENPSYFVDYIHHTYPHQKFKLFVPGERLIYAAEESDEELELGNEE
ncbi:MBL fold metallo-hydrolase [Paenibacillus sp. FJAT-26967]|uniref:MBL fold metallo-hydrolase n=1 Tax=Paenibacillus sp. FJAT-26967 TaxID=1729690 RepID=UPI00083853F2|nr:MBL fold metallo-hydrolase [Paenibacillus sp. FJAT-26967]